MKKTKTEDQYMLIIMEKVAEALDQIGIENIDKADNATTFIHALANIVPTTVYNKLTNSDENMLSFNHIANRLCFQNMTAKP